MNRCIAGSALLLLFCAAVPLTGEEAAGQADDSEAQIIEQRGGGKVRLARYADGTWQLLVDGAPYLVKGIEYSADPIGRTPQGSNEWMSGDCNNNTLSDGPYDSWVDVNGDDYQDPDEETVGDFQLLKDMGCNTIRLYHPENIDKDLLRDLYAKYGIRVIMGNFFGAYTKGSGADWSCGTDYSDPAQRENMKESVRQMVLEHKDEPYVLMWMLGNENDVVGSYENSTYNNTNAAGKPEVFAEFLGEVCEMIKSLDPDHPVGVCNAYTKLLPYYQKFAPGIDVIGINAYSGYFGFGTLWNRVKTSFDRPVLITEYGCDSIDEKKKREDEEYQAQYHRRAWKDIEANSYLGEKAGNAVGGVVYCWLDKWWLCGPSAEHDTEAGKWKGPKKDGFFHDEWMGICAQGDGSRSPFSRRPRKVYYTYRDELWNQKDPQ